jgi:hypothetical protein
MKDERQITDKLNEFGKKKGWKEILTEEFRRNLRCLSCLGEGEWPRSRLALGTRLLVSNNIYRI